MTNQQTPTFAAMYGLHPMAGQHPAPGFQQYYPGTPLLSAPTHIVLMPPQRPHVNITPPLPTPPIPQPPMGVTQIMVPPPQQQQQQHQFYGGRGGRDDGGRGRGRGRGGRGGHRGAGSGGGGGWRGGNRGGYRGQGDADVDEEAAGTASGIVAKLESPEEIEAWIASRKKKFPTRETVEKKLAEEADSFERGELSSERRGWRDGGGGGGGGGGGWRGGRGWRRGGRGGRGGGGYGQRQVPYDRAPSGSASVMPPMAPQQPAPAPEATGPNACEMAAQALVAGMTEAAVVAATAAASIPEKPPTAAPATTDATEPPSAKPMAEPEKMSASAPEEVSSKSVPHPQRVLPPGHGRGPARRGGWRNGRREATAKCVPLLGKLLERTVRKEKSAVLQCIRYIVKHEFFQNEEEGPEDTSSLPSEKPEELIPDAAAGAPALMGEGAMEEEVEEGEDEDEGGLPDDDFEEEEEEETAETVPGDTVATTTTTTTTTTTAVSIPQQQQQPTQEVQTQP